MLGRLVWLIRRVAHRVEYRPGRRALSELRQRWVVFSHPRATIRFGDRVYVGPGFSVDIPANGTLIVGDDCELRRNCRVEIPADGRVTIGNGSYLTYNVVLACSKSIAIGERCGIGFNCGVYDANHRYRDLSRPFLEQGYVYRPITIEDDVQIHSNSVIVNNIGTRTVIGANSVVTKPIPPYVLATGAPAQPIDEFGPAGS
jgi:acetyltransferase-like isoleucine patch superfamily enzyme